MTPDPKLAQQAFMNLNAVGLKYFSEEEYELALRYFLDAFRLQPDSYEALYNVGRALDELHNHMAEDFYAAAAEQGSVDALYQLGVLYDTQGRGREAVDVLTAFLKAYQHEDIFTKDAKSMLDKHDTHRIKLVWSRPFPS
jgi:tetratricopeptide (TPR) repeat protein